MAGSPSGASILKPPATSLDRRGVATNVVPRWSPAGEARSHDEAKLQGVTAGIIEAFEEVVKEHRRRTGLDGLHSWKPT